MLITTVKYTTRGASTLNENEIFSLIFSSIHVNSTLDFLRTLSEASLARSLSLSVNEHGGNSQSVGGPIWSHLVRLCCYVSSKISQPLKPAKL